ncbi:SDR family NAD(P)-dependent oxidoreductase [Myxococcus sp. 1LA]
MKRILIIGASRGLGLALAEGLPEPGDRVWRVSRTQSRPAPGEWIQADLRRPREAADALAAAVGDTPLDALIYNAGIWEQGPFDETPEQDLIDIVNVNLTSLLLCLRRLAPNLRSASSAHVILIGSTCGLENEGSSGVAYVATKFGVRGVAHGARALFRRDGIGVTCISPGSIATDVEYAAGRESALERHKGQRMPVHDIVTLIRWIFQTSGGACPKEIQLPSQYDTDV